MKKTIIFCDVCKNQIAPVTDGSFPRATIQLSYGGTGIRISEVCASCYDVLMGAVTTAINSVRPADPAALAPVKLDFD